MNIALFDFDGTITKRDSLIDFIISSFGYRVFIRGMIKLFPFLIMYKLKFIKNWESKEKAFLIFFGNLGLDEFNKLAFDYSINRLPSIIRDNVIQTIEKHKNNGDEIVIVSASGDLWLKPWCDLYNLKLICTILDVKDGIVTGKISGKNCYGIEKSNRILTEYDLSQYETVFAYGDSKGDKEMLQLADVKYYKWKNV